MSKSANSKKNQKKPDEKNSNADVAQVEEEKGGAVPTLAHQQSTISNIATAFNINQFDSDEHSLPKSKLNRIYKVSFSNADISYKGMFAGRNTNVLKFM